MKRRSDGRYCVKFKGADGRTHYIYARTMAEVREKQKARERDIATGIVARKEITFGAYADVWQAARRGTVSPATEHETAKKLAGLADIRWMRLRDITQADVIKLREKMQSDGRSAYYINARLALLRSILGAAVTARYIAYNAADGVKPLRDPARKQARDTVHRALSREELGLVFEYTDTTIYAPVFRLLLYTGMRAGEALALTWDDIDEASGVIHITKTVTVDSTGRRKIGEVPKTEASRRDVPLTDKVKAILPERNGGLLFRTPDGDIVAPQNLDRVLYRFQTRHHPEIDQISVHALRDTFATLMVDQGCPPHVLRDLLGHKTLAMTMDLYYHGCVDNGRQAVESAAFPV